MADSQRNRKAVRRNHAQYYLLITLISFGASVVVTRLYLKLANYPQIGNGFFHIAHVLWGGLLLFAAATLVLVFANRWVYTVGALIGGLGVGLFIDEVGKFITQDNNYFTPLAVPIIYALFLITLLVFLRVRRRPSNDARASLYRSFDIMKEIADGSLDEHGKERLQKQLEEATQPNQPDDLVALAQTIIDYLNSPAAHIVPAEVTLLDRIVKLAVDFEQRFLGQKRLKAILMMGVLAFAVIALIEPGILLGAALLPAATVHDAANSLTVASKVQGSTSMLWFTLGNILQGVIGIGLLFADGLMLRGNDKLGSELSYYGLLASLGAVNLLTIYFDPVQSVVLAIIQIVTLLTIGYYRGHYLEQKQAPGAAPLK